MYNPRQGKPRIYRSLDGNYWICHYEVTREQFYFQIWRAAIIFALTGSRKVEDVHG